MSTNPDFNLQQVQFAATLLRQHLQTYSRDTNSASALQGMRQTAQMLVVHAKRVPDLATARVAEGAAALASDLVERPQERSASVLRTLAQAADLLGARAAQPQPSSKDPFAGIRGLAVDDDEVVLRTTRAALEKAGFAVTAETDAHDALRQASQNLFHFVLTDIMMPGMSGLEFCAALRKLPPYQKTPVIFVTSAADFDNRTQAVLSGGNDLIAKPFIFSELVLKTLILTVKAEPAG